MSSLAEEVGLSQPSPELPQPSPEEIAALMEIQASIKEDLTSFFAVVANFSTEGLGEEQRIQLMFFIRRLDLLTRFHALVIEAVHGKDAEERRNRSTETKKD